MEKASLIIPFESHEKEASDKLANLLCFTDTVEEIFSLCKQNYALQTFLFELSTRLFFTRGDSPPVKYSCHIQ